MTCDFWAESGGRKIAGKKDKWIQWFAVGFLVDTAANWVPWADQAFSAGLQPAEG